MKIRHILAATDFSPRAQTALARAAALAHQHGAVLHLLHVMPSLSWKVFGKALVEHPLITEKQLYDSAQSRLSGIAEAYRMRLGIPVLSHVEIGDASTRIHSYAQCHSIDLMVLGTHGEHVVRDLFVGMTAMRTLHKSKRPTLIARTSSNSAYKKVLVPIDFSDISKTAIDFAFTIAPKAVLHALYVYDVEYEGRMRYAGVEESIIQDYRAAAHQESLRMMQEFIHGLPSGIRISSIVINGYPPGAIMDQVETLRPDLVVMGRRNRNGLDELLLGSVTRHVMHQIDRDLILIGPLGPA